MQRIVYSVYVDVPAEEHYGQSKLKYDTPEKASVTVNAFKKHYRFEDPFLIGFLDHIFSPFGLHLRWF